MLKIRVYLGDLKAGPRQLPEEAAHYLVRVHRLRAGDAFVAFDPEAVLEAEGVLVRVARDGVVGELAAPRAARSGALGAILVQAAGKGDKLEEVVRAATALGASELSIVISERSVARPGSERATRLRAVAVAAARQSGRGDVPLLSGPSPLAEVLDELAARDLALRLCLHPRAPTPLATLISAAPAGAPIALLVGPEGGFSDGELADMQQRGVQLAALGPLTLRTELAAVAALGAIAARLPGVTDRV